MIRKCLFLTAVLVAIVSCTADEPEETEPVGEVVNSEWADAWMINETGQTSPIFDDALVDVEAVRIVALDGINYQCVTASGIPSYLVGTDQGLIDGLLNRPNAVTDFGEGLLNISVGDMIEFGQDIGYEAEFGCTDEGGGAGYWPPGPACPTDQEKEWCFPLEPEPLAEGETCDTGLSQIGMYINGVSIFNWQDGQSYNNENVWVNNALQFEIYDLDVCVGHAADGNYHHHSSPTCLIRQLEDDGSAASPIYGFAADGYPIYGPWEAQEVLVESCWKTRDYDNLESPTGCGEAGIRSCLLVDQYDISKGTVDSAVGPSTSAIVPSLSGNPILAESGAYFQDYYYDPACTAQGDEYLDEHNGHESAEQGYHYHITMVQLEDGTLGFSFPHYTGPTYAGVLTDNAIAMCSTGRRPGGR